MLPWGGGDSRPEGRDEARGHQEGSRAAERLVPRPVLGALLTTVFLDILGYSIILPYLFFFAQSLGASTIAYGIIVTSYAVEQLLFSPLMGRFSDTYGRRTILVLTLLGSAGSYVMFGLSKVLWLLLVSRMLAGAFSGTYPVVQAYIADVTDDQSRLKYMGYLAGAYGLGYVLGPVLGGTLGILYGYWAPSFLAAILAFSNAVVSYVRVPDNRRVIASALPSISLRSVLGILSRTQMQLLLVLNFTSTLAFVFLIVVLPAWLEAIFRFGAFETGMILFYAGCVSIVTVVFAIPRLSKRFSAAGLVMIGTVIVSMNYLGLSFVGSASLASLLWGFAMAGLMSFGISLIGPAVNALISVTSSEDEQGKALGVAQSSAGLARAFAPTMAAVIFSFGVSVGATGLVFFIAALVNAASLPLIQLFRRARLQMTSLVDSTMAAPGLVRSADEERPSSGPPG
jgi:MFS family permease